MKIFTRPYWTSDQSVVLEISADTAFFGEPVDAFLDDRHLYMDAFARYYTEYETSLALVAEGQDGILGFLFGCADTTAQSKRWRGYIATQVLVKAITGRYRLGRPTAGFAWGMLVGKLWGEEPRVDLSAYPAHLQINVREGYRGEGVGRQLIEAYLEQLRQLDYRGVHLTTTSHNEAACHLYKKVGFRLLDERPNRFWTKMLGLAVKNRSFGLKLAE